MINNTIEEFNSNESGYSTFSFRTPATWEKSSTIKTTNASCSELLSGLLNKSSNTFMQNETKHNKLDLQLSKLQLALEYVSPVIDDIVSHATSYSRVKFMEILASKSPICAITYTQYSKAFRASEIINEINSELYDNNWNNYFPLQHIIVNTVAKTQVSNFNGNMQNVSERVYVDKELMNQLVDLHELIIETIKKLKICVTVAPNLEDKSTYKSDTVAFPLETSNTLVKEKSSDDAAKDEETEITSFSLPTDDNNQNKNNIDKQPNNEDNLSANGEILVINNEFIKKDETYIVNASNKLANRKKKQPLILTVDPTPCIPNCEIITKKLVASIPSKELDLESSYEVVSIPPYPVKPKVAEPTLSDVKLINQQIEPIETKDRDSNATLLESNESVKNGDQTENTNCENELKKMKRLFLELEAAINYIKTINVIKISNTYIPSSKNPLKPTNRSDSSIISERKKLFSEMDSASRTQREILECLKQLTQMKELMTNMDNPELVLDKKVNLVTNVPCCSLAGTPHVHAKLKGIPVVIRIDDDTIDILLSETYKKREPHQRPCECKKPNKVVLPNNKYIVQQATYKTCLTNNQLVLSKPKRSISNYCYSNTNIFEVLDLKDSINSLPYMVTRTSLPNVNICSAMKISLENLKSNVQDTEISHPKNNIKEKLKFLGIDNIILASKPAKCCRRKAVINRKQTEEEPFHASLNSLPLSKSDLKEIIQNIGQETICMSLTKLYKSKYEYYTNFQENFASNINYFIPKHKVYEVRYFEVSRKEEKNEKASKARAGETKPNPWNIFSESKVTNMVRKLISNDYCDYNTNSTEMTLPTECNLPLKSMHNKKCQTDFKRRIRKPNVEESTKKVKKKSKKLYTTKDSYTMCKLTEYSSKSMNTIYSAEKYNLKTKQNSFTSKTCHLKPLNILHTNQNVYNCNTNGNLGTIYEGEEKCTTIENSNETIENNLERFYEFLRSPTISASFQKFIATETAQKASEKIKTSNFPNSNFDSKNIKKTVSTTSNDTVVSNRVTQQRIRVYKKRKSRIPKRIKNKSKCSDSSSDYSILTVKNKDASVVCEKQESSGKAKIYFADFMDDKNDMDDMQSLQLLASRNGPGYISVLHPECGCPEVSIFIPCYCDEACNSPFKCPKTLECITQKHIERHVILPKSCRIGTSQDSELHNLCCKNQDGNHGDKI